MSDKLKKLIRDFIFYGKGGHLTRAIEIAEEIEIQVNREAAQPKPEEQTVSG